MKEVDIYPCGCSRHKVALGLCNLYGPGAGERYKRPRRRAWWPVGWLIVGLVFGLCWHGCR